MENVKILTQELWDLIIRDDDGKKVEEIRALKKREDRRGRTKRLLTHAIDKSSVGLFNGLLHFFNGTVYTPINIRTFKRALYDIMSDKIELPDGDLAKLADIYDDCINVVFSKPLTLSSNIMLFKNGALDVETGEFHRNFNKKYVQMWTVDYDYNPKARTFLWYQFLNQVLPDKYLQNVLQMFLGATFVDRKKVKIEHIMILLGKGANGKSVIQNVVCGVLGEQCVSTQEVGRLCARGNDGDMSVAEINGKRLNYCTEMEVTDFYRKSARLKAIVSGENVTARQLYGTPFKATNIPLLMANANQLPIFNKKDDALVRRIYIIPFSVTIPPEKQNKTLSDELMDEYPGILNWILEGREKFIKNGYRLPQDINLSRFIQDEQAEFSSPLKYMSVNGWLAKIDGVDLEPVNWIKQSNLYKDYVRWCGMNNLESVTKTAFVVSLENQGGYQRKRMADGYYFAVFGDITMNTLRKEKYKLRQVEKDAPKAILMWVEGTAWVTSQRALAAYAGVSPYIVNRIAREGKFEKHTKAYREKKIYDVKACCEVMRMLRIIATDEEKEIDHRIRKELKYMRYIFNQRMEFNGWPYRKYALGEDQIDGCIVVPDETGDEEVYKMAKKAGYDTSLWSSYRGLGIYGKGGKGFFNSKDEIPTEEERKKYKRKKKKS